MEDTKKKSTCKVRQTWYVVLQDTKFTESAIRFSEVGMSVYMRTQVSGFESIKRGLS